MARIRLTKVPRTPSRSATGGMVLDLERYVPGLLTFVANKLSRSANAVYQRDFGVSVTEWRVLSQLAIEPAITASRICQVIGFDKGPISRTLDGMEKDGLVETKADLSDARRRLVSLTRKGREVHDRIIQVALEREKRLLACLDPAETETLIELLNRLHGHLPAVTETGLAVSSPDGREPAPGGATPRRHRPIASSSRHRS